MVCALHCRKAERVLVSFNAQDPIIAGGCRRRASNLLEFHRWKLAHRKAVLDCCSCRALLDLGRLRREPVCKLAIRSALLRNAFFGCAKLSHKLRLLCESRLRVRAGAALRGHRSLKVLHNLCSFPSRGLHSVLGETGLRDSELLGQPTDLLLQCFVCGPDLQCIAHRLAHLLLQRADECRVVCARLASRFGRAQQRVCVQTLKQTSALRRERQSMVSGAISALAVGIEPL
mmetsp:Transcript_17573/g.50298  ORF Transcript_17573/g.50298 Transcript_17573/m.50298 type:complete len:231 (-) Transcript_17573:84-776(-)